MDGRSLRLSVVVCTHNRSADVAECLAALAQQTTREPFEILVVDSGSGAEHRDSLKQSAERLGVKLIRVDEPGLSKARNVGFAEARGRWVAYLDDDALPRSDWAEHVFDVIAHAPAEAVMIGGKIVPYWPISPAPAYVTRRWKLFLSCVEDTDRKSTAKGANICGANFILDRTRVVDDPPFPEELGRDGLRLIGGEEAYVVRRLQQKGLDVLYDPSFVVDHKIPDSRLTLKWLRNRSFWEGVTIVKLHDILGEPRPLAIHPVKLAISLPILWLTSKLSRNADFLIRFNVAYGSLSASLRSVP